MPRCWRRLLKMKPERREEVLIAFDLYVMDMKLDVPTAKLSVAVASAPDTGREQCQPAELPHPG